LLTGIGQLVLNAVELPLHGIDVDIDFFLAPPTAYDAFLTVPEEYTVRTGIERSLRSRQLR
jgi:hypothetical protein